MLYKALPARTASALPRNDNYILEGINAVIPAFTGMTTRDWLPSSSYDFARYIVAPHNREAGPK
jgi:hypothetical protein